MQLPKIALFYGFYITMYVLHIWMWIDHETMHTYINNRYSHQVCERNQYVDQYQIVSGTWLSICEMEQNNLWFYMLILRKISERILCHYWLDYISQYLGHWYWGTMIFGILSKMTFKVQKMKYLYFKKTQRFKKYL